jgi:hypothetical protein
MRGQMHGHLPGQLRGQPPRLVQARELGELIFGGISELTALLIQGSTLGITVRTDRHILPGGQRQRPGQQPGQASGQQRLRRVRRPGDADHQPRSGHQPVIDPQHPGPQHVTPAAKPVLALRRALATTHPTSLPQISITRTSSRLGAPALAQTPAAVTTVQDRSPRLGSGMHLPCASNTPAVYLRWTSQLGAGAAVLTASPGRPRLKDPAGSAWASSRNLASLSAQVLCSAERSCTIGLRLGISQMHVSRLRTRALGYLRSCLLGLEEHAA